MWNVSDFHSSATIFLKIRTYDIMQKCVELKSSKNITFTFLCQVLHENSKREVFVCQEKFHSIKCAIKECISKRSKVWWWKLNDDGYKNKDVGMLRYMVIVAWSGSVFCNVFCSRSIAAFLDCWLHKLLWWYCREI